MRTPTKSKSEERLMVNTLDDEQRTLDGLAFKIVAEMNREAGKDSVVSSEDEETLHQAYARFALRAAGQLKAVTRLRSAAQLQALISSGEEGEETDEVL
jgi:hypothetical protein